MVYYIAQFIGILVAVGAVINLQLKKKKQMLVCSIIVNILSALNIFLLGETGSSVIIILVAVVQIIFCLWHECKNTDVKLAEKLLFLVLYIGCGAIAYKRPLDLLSIVAAVFYMISMFQKKEQNVRLFLLVNMASWTVYDIVIKSTAVFAQIAGIISSVIALCRYRKKEHKNEA